MLMDNPLFQMLFLNKFNLFYSSLTVHFNVCCLVRFLVAAQTRAHCVFLLALLSKSVCGDWRSSVYRWALQSNSESERASAVRGFPLLLHNLGVKSYSLIHEVLLYVILKSHTLRKKKKSIQVWLTLIHDSYGYGRPGNIKEF